MCKVFLYSTAIDQHSRADIALQPVHVYTQDANLYVGLHAFLVFCLVYEAIEFPHLD